VTFDTLLQDHKENKKLIESLQDPFAWSDKPIRVTPGQSSKGSVVAKEFKGFIIYSGDSSIAKVRQHPSLPWLQTPRFIC
jgi:hypothetical protein